jgi:hypothetical protein
VKDLTKVLIKINIIDPAVCRTGGVQMQKKAKILGIFLSIIFLFGSCAANKGVTSKTTVNLVNYTNQGILMIAELEQKSLARYASVTGENYTTDQRVYDELNSFIIPNYMRFVDGLRAIKPEDKEIIEVHAIYVNAAELMYRGFNAKMAGIEKNDEALILEANKNIEKARDESARWRLALIELYKKYGVTEKAALGK